MSAANQTAAQQARILLEFFGPNGERWCQNSDALDSDGAKVSCFGPEAVRFCVTGRACRVFGEDRLHLYEAILPTGRGHYDGVRILMWNDSNPWEVVKAKLEEIAAS